MLLLLYQVPFTNIRIINNSDFIEMEQTSKHNKRIGGVRSFIFPHKTSNRIGVDLPRSQSAKENDVKPEVAILKRPLSLSIKNRKMNDQLPVPNVSLEKYNLNQHI